MKINIVNKTEFDLPKYQTSGSAGMDLMANIEDELVLEPHKQILVPTGIYISLPKPEIIYDSYGNPLKKIGYEAQIRPRSGLAAKYGISIVNSPGTIDSDWRGEIKVILINLTDIPYTIKKGDRISQMIISSYEIVEWVEVDNLDETERGKGGFGSTGK